MNQNVGIFLLIVFGLMARAEIVLSAKAKNRAKSDRSPWWDVFG